MGRQDEVGVTQRLHQGVVGGRWLDACHIEPGAAEATVAERLQQGLLVHQAAAAHVDQQSPRFHHGQLPRTYQVAGVGGERAVQADDVRALQQLVEGQPILVVAGADLALGIKDLHADGTGPLPQGLSQGALADDAEALAVQIRDGVIEEAELAALLPAPLQQGLAPGEQVARQGQHQRHGVFWHRGARVVADVAHADVGGAARLQIQVVAAGGRQGDQAQLRQLGQFVLADADLVDDGDAGAPEPLHHLFRLRLGVALPVMGEIGATQIDAGVQGVTVEKHDLLH
ncbi:hypothetical protein D3C80_934670 [compost metagenome]